MKKHGKGTGTIRRLRMDGEIADWVECDHKCRICQRRKLPSIWSHKIPAGFVCNLSIFYRCPTHLEFPNPYGHPLTVATKRKEKKKHAPT